VNRGLALVGCGGHARSVAAVAIAAGYERLVFFDQNARSGETLLGFPVLPNLPEVKTDWSCIPCAGDNSQREAQFRELASAEWSFATIISPYATVDPGARIGPACFVGHHAHVGPLANVGCCTIMNTGAIVEHDCSVGDSCHVSIRASLAGRVRLGARVMIGAGAVVINDVSICGDVTIGAGATVIANIEIAGVYVGVPARTKSENR
jgi:sugar O-acyltransferase (sialic acid O-acetyltransferase NeuD family)